MKRISIRDIHLNAVRSAIGGEIVSIEEVRIRAAKAALNCETQPKSVSNTSPNAEDTSSHACQ